MSGGVPRPLRHHPVEKRPYLVEVTTRCIQGRLLLRPSTQVNKVVLGVIGRALALYRDVKLVDFVILGNHYHIKLLIEDEGGLARFMEFVNGKLSDRIGTRLHDWRGAMWETRYKAMPIIDDPSMQDRLKYVWSNGVKEGFVASPLDWPGASSVRARLLGEKLIGYWYHEAEISAARLRGNPVDPEDFVTKYEIELAPLPCLDDLDDDEYLRRATEIVREIEREAGARHADKGTQPLGADFVLQQDPHTRPRKSARRRAPLCHASSRKTRKAYRKLHMEFSRTYYERSDAVLAGERGVEFPSWCFPPARPFVRPGGRLKPREPP